MASILYISYDGMLEPLGQSQVLQYLIRLAERHHIVLISFEKASDWNNKAEQEKARAMIADSKIIWRPLRYHKWPSTLATAFDITVGILVGSWFALRYRCNIVHARSYVPSVIALALKKLMGIKYVFDMRGFWVDERVDGGLWSGQSRIYKVAKRFERYFLGSADAVVSLTHAAVPIIKEFDRLRKNKTAYYVIPTCTNLEKFRPRDSRGNENKITNFTLGYIGSVGTWYMLDPVAKCFKILLRKRPESHMLIVSPRDHEVIRNCFRTHGVPPEKITIKAVSYSSMPDEINQMTAGVFFIKPVFSKLASSPTRLGEFLACGIPCLGNSGIGDMEQILEGDRVGIVLHDFDDTGIDRAVQELLQLTEEADIRRRCELAAKKHFSLENGVATYGEIYSSLTL